jgi:Protein of unknown function (DUF2953)
VLILLTKLKVHIKYSHAQDNDLFKIQLKAWFGLLRYTFDVPLIKVDENSPSIVVEEETKTGKQENINSEKRSQFFAQDIINGLKDMEKLLKHVVSLHRIVRHFLKKVTVNQLEWQTIIGTGEAALTGVLTGAVWAVKGSIIGMISHYFKLKVNPALSVQPHFQLPVSQTSFQCMLQFRIGHAIFAGIKLIKCWKGGRPQFKSRLFSSLSHEKTNTV